MEKEPKLQALLDSLKNIPSEKTEESFTKPDLSKLNSILKQRQEHRQKLFHHAIIWVWTINPQLLS